MEKESPSDTSFRSQEQPISILPSILSRKTVMKSHTSSLRSHHSFQNLGEVRVARVLRFDDVADDNKMDSSPARIKLKDTDLWKLRGKQLTLWAVFLVCVVYLSILSFSHQKWSERSWKQIKENQTDHFSSKDSILEHSTNFQELSKGEALNGTARNILLPNKARILTGSSSFCNRSDALTDICTLEGDVRLDVNSRLAFVYSKGRKPVGIDQIRPYPAKWDVSVMASIDEMALSWRRTKIRKMPRQNVTKAAEGYREIMKVKMTAGSDHMEALERQRRVLGIDGRRVQGPINPELVCDVDHKDVPGVLFSVGGLRENSFYDWRDVIIPLWITVQHHKGEIVLIMLQTPDSWIKKYAKLLKQLSRYPLILPGEDPYIHCFKKLTLGLKTLGSLSIDSSLMPAGKSTLDFQEFVEKAFGLDDSHPPEDNLTGCQPILTLLSHTPQKILTNEDAVIRIATELGFSVHVFSPNYSTPVEQILRQMRQTDVLFGVQGPFLTYFIFLQNGSAFVQVVPLGLSRPAHDLISKRSGWGLQYLEYVVKWYESSLADNHSPHDPILEDSDLEFSRGRQDVFLYRQNVTLSEIQIRNHLLPCLRGLKKRDVIRGIDRTLKYPYCLKAKEE